MKRGFGLLLMMLAIIPSIVFANEVSNNNLDEQNMVDSFYGNRVIRKGDLNKNSKLELLDIIELIKKYLNFSETTHEDLELVDMNNNNKVDMQDIIKLFKVYLIKGETEIVYEGYYINNDYSYIGNYNGLVYTKDDLINYIYYNTNIGEYNIKAICSDEYLECITDYNNIFDNGEIWYVNNFVHPFNSISNISYYESKIDISITRRYSENEIQEIDEFVDNKIDELITDEMSDYKKIKVIHDYIINNTEYDVLRIDDNPDNNETYKSNTAYGVLFEGKGVCSGYTDAMAIFLNKLGIPNYQIGNKRHIWNLVYVDDEWYHLDVTWDDPITNVGNVLINDFFLIDYDTLVSLDTSDHYFDKDIFIEAY